MRANAWMYPRRRGSADRRGALPPARAPEHARRRGPAACRGHACFPLRCDRVVVEARPDARAVA